ncbi:MAG: hypothetical protein R3Y28_02450 [Candidatus Gastranaerophilales bacterium]
MKQRASATLKEIKKIILYMIHKANVSHVGTAFSAVDILCPLYFNVEKVNRALGRIPTLTVDEAILNTVEWYKKFYNDENIMEFTIEQIKEYEENIKWNKSYAIK